MLFETSLFENLDLWNDCKCLNASSHVKNFELTQCIKSDIQINLPYL